MLIEYTHVLASWIDMSSNNSPTVAMSSGFHSPFGADTPAWANNDWYYSIDWRITPTRVLTDSLPSFNVGLVDSIVSDASVWSDLLVAAKSSKVSLKHKYSLFQTSWVDGGMDGGERMRFLQPSSGNSESPQVAEKKRNSDKTKRKSLQLLTARGILTTLESNFHYMQWCKLISDGSERCKKQIAICSSV